jgi:hypothetical protein
MLGLEPPSHATVTGEAAAGPAASMRWARRDEGLRGTFSNPRRQS